LAYALGCEGIVSKRLGSTYRSGRVNDWLKIKNPTAPALMREKAREIFNAEVRRRPRIRLTIRQAHGCYSAGRSPARFGWASSFGARSRRQDFTKPRTTESLAVSGAI
jgi:hypothetical protein